jgi:hypothetical protein
MRVCRSPELIAAYHGLHRLRVPRHPPLAFARLTTNCQAEHARSNKRVIPFFLRWCGGNPKISSTHRRKRVSLVLIRFPRSYPFPLSNSVVLRGPSGGVPERSPDSYEKIEDEIAGRTRRRLQKRFRISPTRTSELTYSLLR